jgi:hypothetical protein
MQDSFSVNIRLFCVAHSCLYHAPARAGVGEFIVQKGPKPAAFDALSKRVHRKSGLVGGFV